jgi:hypothetical protein
MLAVVMLIDIVPNVVRLIVIVLAVVMLIDIVLGVVMLSVAIPKFSDLKGGCTSGKLFSLVYLTLFCG